MEKQAFLKLAGITEEQFCGREEINGDLYLGSLTSIPDGFNPTVGGSLYLGSLTSIPDGFNPTVGGSLYLGSLTSIPDGFNPTVGGDLYLGSLTSIPDGFNPTVGGSLYLGSLTSIPDGFNPTVGGSLDLGSLTSIPDGFNPTVGGDLYLGSLTSIPDGFNPTVGGDLYLPPGMRCGKNPMPLIIESDGLVLADGVLAKVVSKKSGIWKLARIGTNKALFLAVGETHVAHGKTVRQAVADLKFKESGRDKSQFEHLTMHSSLTVEDAIVVYRVVTGACSAGVEMFIETLGKLKESYTVAEIVELTKGQYNAKSFVDFVQGGAA